MGRMKTLTQGWKGARGGEEGEEKEKKEKEAHLDILRWRTSWDWDSSRGWTSATTPGRFGSRAWRRKRCPTASSPSRPWERTWPSPCRSWTRCPATSWVLLPRPIRRAVPSAGAPASPAICALGRACTWGRTCCGRRAYDRLWQLQTKSQITIKSIIKY